MLKRIKNWIVDTVAVITTIILLMLVGVFSVLNFIVGGIESLLNKIDNISE